MEQSRTNRVRLADFELDLKTGELCPFGTTESSNKILLREQPFQVLRMLVERGGEIVTREEIRRKLWPNSTIVDFDHSINVAIGVLRRALGDSAGNPQYIGTLARRGYRLLVPTEWLEATDETTTVESIVARPKVKSDSLIGKKVSHFRVLEIIGGGGMGMVYKAEDLKLGRPVALKFLPEEMADDPVALRRFELEAQTASALNHPNICTIYAVEEYEAQPFIAMELLEGDTLLNRIASSDSRVIGLNQLLEIGIQICNGLEAAHDKDIIHRDIKPANLFLTTHGTLKILDFGLAKLAASEEVASSQNAEQSEDTAISGAVDQASTNDSEPVAGRISPSLTRTGTTAGTAGYMSPEQVRKESLDSRTDLFSFGLVLYEMASGRRAFGGQTMAEVQDAILNQKPTAVHEVKSSIPRRLDAVITKALEKDRTQRYQTASEIRHDLERVRREIQPARRLSRWLAGAVGLILVLAAGIWFYQNYRHRVTLSNDDTIVLADIDNQTGDPVFDDALNAALHYGMEQTPYLSVLGPDKVIATLRLLNLPPTTKVTQEIARQVCLRTNSRMVIASSVADSGNRFQIELTAIDSASGTVAAQVRKDAASRDYVVQVLGDLAVQLRRKLGEPSVSLSRFNKPLEVATSSSLEALQAGMIGYKHHIAGDFRGAVPYYQHGIELDSNLALAYEALGSAKGSLFEDKESIDAFKKAYELRDRMTEPNRFHTEFLYYQNVTGELEKAYLGASQAVETFPRDVLARNNLASVLIRLGQPDRAADQAREAARQVPNSYSYGLLMFTSINADRLNEAKAAFEDAVARKIDSPEVHLNRTRLAFLQHDDAALEEEWSWSVGKANEDYFVRSKATIQSYYGHFRSARELIQRAIDMDLKAGLQFDETHWITQEADIGNFEKARARTAQILKTALNRDQKIYLALDLALVGDTKQAEKLADAIDQESPLNTSIQYFHLPTIRAALKLHQNDPAAAVEILRPVLKYDLAYPPSFQSLRPVYLRGMAYLQLGDGRQAAAEFQKVLDHRGIVGRDVHGALSYLQLARAQKLYGDHVAARKSYEDFLTLWKDADPDVPIYQQAKAEYAAIRKN